jgi:hypothetical protein
MAITLQVENATFNITGQDVEMFTTNERAIGFEHFFVEFNDVDLRRSYKLDVESNTFPLTGSDVALENNYTLNVEPNTFPLSGSDVTIDKVVILEAENTTYPVTYSDVELSKYCDSIYSLNNDNFYDLYSYKENAFYGGRFVKNYVETSEYIDLPWWSLSTNVTVTNNYAIAPDGSNTATRFEGTTTNWYMRRAFSEFLIGMTGTFSIWVKSNTGSDQTFKLRCLYNLSPVLTATTTWQRFSHTHTSTLANYQSDIEHNGTTVDLLIWHPQMEKGDKPSEFISTVGYLEHKVFSTTNENSVTNNIVTENPGNSLGYIPYLVNYLEFTNSNIYSRDLTNWTASGTATGSVSLTGLGVDNVPNTCSIINVSAATSGQYYQVKTDNITIPTSVHDFVCTSVLIEKDGTSNVTEIKLQFGGSTSQEASFTLNQSTGAITPVKEESIYQDYLVIDRGDWWQALLYVVNQFGSSYANLIIYATTDGTTAIVGDTVVDFAQVFINKDINKVKDLPPIPTNGNILTFPNKIYEWDASYHTDQGAYIFNFRYDGGYYDLLKIGDSTAVKIDQLKNINDDICDEQPSSTNWHHWSDNNTLEDDNGALKITYVDNPDGWGAYTLLNSTDCLTRDLEEGERVFISAEIKASLVSSNISYRITTRQEEDVVIPIYDTDDFYKVETYATVGRHQVSPANNPLIIFIGMAVGDIVWIKNLKVYSCLDSVVAVDGNGTETGLPILQEHNTVGIAYGQEQLVLNLNGKLSKQISFYPWVSGNISSNGYISELKHYNNSFARSIEIIKNEM